MFPSKIWVADPHHSNADPDPAFYLDPDPVPHQSVANRQTLVYRTSRAPF